MAGLLGPVTPEWQLREMAVNAIRERDSLREELDARIIALDQANRRIRWLEGALRPFSNTVCSMRWCWRDTDDPEGELKAEENGLTCDWNELLDAHEALSPEGCAADDCRGKGPTQAGSADGDRDA